MSDSSTFDCSSATEANLSKTPGDAFSDKYGRHDEDSLRPAKPTHRVANPSPLGLLTFATSVFLMSITGVQARGIQTPNIIVGVMIFYSGISQLVCAIMEFVSGNTFGATFIASWSGFNFSYAMIFIPWTGILAAYTDEATGQLRPEFNDALAMVIWVWFALTFVFVLCSLRSTWLILIILTALDAQLLCLAVGNMLKNSNLMTAGFSIGFFVSFMSFWAGSADLLASTPSPVRIPAFPMKSA